MKVVCPNCSVECEALDDFVGKKIQCPNCKESFVLGGCGAEPRRVDNACADDSCKSENQAHNPTQSLDTTDVIFCTKCGQKNNENNFKCTECGFVLHDEPGQYVVDESPIGVLIPYKNAQALWAYYLGIFSLIPCVGLPLGVAALVLGIRGLGCAKRNSESKGKVHAWIGIVLGGLSVLVYVVLILVSVIGGVLAAMSEV